jgi:hypothetical protein
MPCAGMLQRTTIQATVEISNVQTTPKHPADRPIKADRIRSITDAVCGEWVRIVKQFQATAKAYGEAAAELPGVPGAEFNRGWSRAESLRKESKRLRAALFEHEHQHGCSVVRAH